MNNKKPLEKRLKEYHALPPLQKTVVQLLAVNVDYMRIAVMIDCLTDPELKPDDDLLLTPAALQSIQKELSSKGLLIKSAKGMMCPESIRKQALWDTLATGAFTQIAETIQKKITLPDTEKRGNPFKNYQELIRSFQIALFTQMTSGDFIPFVNYYAHQFFHNDYLSNNPYHSILNNPFSSEVMEFIHPQIRMEVTFSLLEICGELLERTDEILCYILNTYHTEFTGKRLAIRLINHHLVCGNISSALVLGDNLKEDLQPEQLSRRGWVKCICGDYREANALFEEAIRCIKKSTGKRKLFLQSYAGIFYLLALLQTNDEPSLRKGLEYITIARRNKYPVYPVTELLKPLFESQMGLPVTSLSVPDMQHYKDHPLPFFLISLALTWTDSSLVEEYIPDLTQNRNKAQKNGYTWLAAELSALLAVLGQDKARNQTLAGKLHKSCGTVSLVKIVREQPQWEKTLNDLLAIGKTGKKAKPDDSKTQRLVWWFSHSEKYNHCYITPRLQKLTKKGTWTKGRSVAMKNLYQNHHTMEGLTSQDRQICRAITEETYRSGYGYYGKTDYIIEYDRALPALVGHPLLFLERSPDVHIELILAEPEVRLVKEKGKLKLSVFPSRATDEVQVVKDTPTRFKVVRFSAHQSRIIEVLQKELTIPKSGEQLARQVVDSLSSLVTVHSDIATNAKTKIIKANSTPHAHITPHHEGICLEFLVKPCGTDGSSFRPGKGGKNVLTERKGERIQAVRNFTLENRKHGKVINSCPTFSHLEEFDRQWLVEDPEDALELLLELKECGDDVILEWPQGEKPAVRKQVSFDSFSMQIKKDRNWFKASGSLQIDGKSALDLKKLLDLLDQGTGRFILLDDGTFLALTGALQKRLEELRAFSENHGKGVRFSPLASLALEDLSDEAGQLKTDKSWKTHCKKLAEVINPELPSTLQGSLRDYQQTGFNWLAQLSHWGVGACLADDMGLGKTIQALAAILLRAADGPTLVVAPLSVTSNWQEEAVRFAPTLNVIVFGPGDRQEVINNLQPFDMLIVSYGLLPLEAELLCGVQWQTVVLDEAQAIKNMQTKRSKTAMGLQSEFRIITTGTPVENHLGELWTLFNFLNPGLLGSFKGFNEKFAIPIERDQDNESRNRLRKLIRPFILRRLKNDVLQELPAKTEINLEVEMSRDESLLYEAQRIKALENISAHDDEGAGQQHLRILGEIMKLRRLCCNPSLVLPDCNIAGSKLKVFGDTLQELLGNKHKALVFSQFVGHLEILRNYLDAADIRYQYLDGSTTIKKRKQRIADFQNGEGDVFLISLKAGGAGLNLTAADYVIHMDPWWNPAVEDQASDRAHRIGQKRPVTVYRLVVKDSIEEQIVALHKQKRDLADTLLEGADAAGKISARELLGLLQDKAQRESAVSG